MHLHLSVETEHAGLELDEFLAQTFPRLPKRFLRSQVRAGDVLVDGSPANPAQRLRVNQVVSFEMDEAALPEAAPATPAVPIEVLYEDAHVLAVYKPADLLVEPDRWDETRPNLADSLARWADERGAGGGPGERFRPRLVHRLDAGTSGVVLVARTLEAERALREAFDQGLVEKHYDALIEGELRLEPAEELVIDLPVGPEPKRSGRMIARVGAEKPALTIVRVREAFRGFTLVDCEPRTGRTHQIRVHLAAEGFPLAVDPLYGRRDALFLSELKPKYREKRGRPEPALIRRLTLHARTITFPRVEAPAERVTVEAPHAKDFLRVLKQLAKVRPPRR